ncbi:basic proline-rich protein-like [Gavia stellata]|uniref:basic proline-rich protein-like n=1 Tax=Gavia stellata TaxID=37040 RepID=UPI00289CE75C|nr:basic proline-rich protein-like [Gavia stellata]
MPPGGVGKSRGAGRRPGPPPPPPGTPPPGTPPRASLPESPQAAALLSASVGKHWDSPMVPRERPCDVTAGGAGAAPALHKGGGRRRCARLRGSALTGSTWPGGVGRGRPAPPRPALGMRGEGAAGPPPPAARAASPSGRKRRDPPARGRPPPRGSVSAACPRLGLQEGVRGGRVPSHQQAPVPPRRGPRLSAPRPAGAAAQLGGSFGGAALGCGGPRPASPLGLGVVSWQRGCLTGTRGKRVF